MNKNVKISISYKVYMNHECYSYLHFKEISIKSLHHLTNKILILFGQFRICNKYSQWYQS